MEKLVKLIDQELILEYTTELTNFEDFEALLDNQVVSYVDDSNLSNYLIAFCLVSKMLDNKLLWKIAFPSLISDTPQIVHVEKRIFLKYGYKIHCLNLYDGKRAWNFTNNVPLLKMYMLNQFYLVIVSDSGVVFLDTNGNLIWNYDHNELITDSFIEGEKLYLNDFSYLTWELDVTKKISKTV